MCGLFYYAGQAESSGRITAHKGHLHWQMRWCVCGKKLSNGAGVWRITEAWQWQQHGECLWPKDTHSEWHLACGWGADGLQRLTWPAPTTASNGCWDVHDSYLRIDTPIKQTRTVWPDTIYICAGWRVSGWIQISQTLVSHVAMSRPKAPATGPVFILWGACDDKQLSEARCSEINLNSWVQKYWDGPLVEVERGRSHRSSSSAPKLSVIMMVNNN